MADSVIHQLLFVPLNLLPVSIKILFPCHYYLLDKAKPRKKMRTRFCPCYNVTQTQVNFKYPQERRVLKCRKTK